MRPRSSSTLGKSLSISVLGIIPISTNIPPVSRVCSSPVTTSLNLIAFTICSPNTSTVSAFVITFMFGCAETFSIVMASAESFSDRLSRVTLLAYSSS